MKRALLILALFAGLTAGAETLPECNIFQREGQLVIKSEIALSGEVTIEITDVLGKRIVVLHRTLTGHTNEWELSTGTLPTGIYMVKIQNGPDVQVKRLSWSN